MDDVVRGHEHVHDLVDRNDDLVVDGNRRDAGMPFWLSSATSSSDSMFEVTVKLP